MFAIPDQHVVIPIRKQGRISPITNIVGAQTNHHDHLLGSVENLKLILCRSDGALDRVLEDGGYSKRFLAAYKKHTPTERSIFSKVKGRYAANRPKVWWHTYINQDGKREDAPFYGENLQDVQALRRAINMRQRGVLNQLAIKHRQGIADANGVMRHPEFNLNRNLAALRQMTTAERASFKKAEYYSDKQAEAA
jgi:hypothetical protein